MVPIRSWFAALLVGAVFAAGSATAAADLRLITIGTAAKGGVYYPAGGAICLMVNEHRLEHGIRCATKATEGSLANLKALRAGDLDIAVVQSDWQYRALSGPAGANTPVPV